MALGQGSKKSISCDQGVTSASPNGWVGEGGLSVTQQTRRIRCCKCLLAFLLIILIAAGAILTWYFLEYRVWVLEPRVQQQYTAHLSILNRNFSADLSLHNSPAFRKEARAVQKVVEKIMKASTLSRYFNYTSVFAFGDGSVVAHFWIIMSVPSSHVERITLGMVTNSLETGLRWYRESEEEDTARCDGYLLHLPSLSVSGESRRGRDNKGV